MGRDEEKVPRSEVAHSGSMRSRTSDPKSDVDTSEADHVEKWATGTAVNAPLKRDSK